MPRFAVFVVLCTLLLAACRLGGDPEEGTQASGDEPGAEAPAGEQPPDAPADEPAPISPRVSAPTDATSVLTEDDADTLALAASQTLFEEAPVVLLAAGDDLEAQTQAASLAVPLGVPMLVLPPAAGEGADGAAAQVDRLVDELDRLGASTLVTFDEGSRAWAEERGDDHAVVRAPSDPDELAESIAGAPASTRTVAPDEVVREIAALRRDESVILAVERPDPDDGPGPAEEEEEEDGSEPSGEEEGPEPSGDRDGAEASAGDGTATGRAAVAASTAGDDDLSRLEAAPPLDSVAVLAAPDEAGVAAAATARAAGARVLVLDDPDPRADPDAIAALSEEPPDEVLALGGDFGDPELLRDRVEVAATGVELPGGGQVLFPGRRMVALYGHPDTPALGALGEQPLEDTVRRAEEVASNYEPHSDVPVVPTFEIITTIASASAGPEGDYSRVTDVDVLRPWIDEAREAGHYVVLDLQPGRTDFLTQAQLYEELLLEPHVGLALDPEWRLEPDQVHLEQIGSVDAEEINTVVTWLADLTREHQLPQKLLVLHQFRHAMITNRDAVDTSRDELAVLIHADGHGTPDLKRETWDALTESPPADVFWGWKNFYRQDNPTWSAEEVLELEPDPLFISYQ